MKKEVMERLETVEKLFFEGKKDEEISKALKLHISKIPNMRSILGLQRHALRMDIFNGDLKRTNYNDKTEKHNVSFWIPHEEAKRLGLTDSKYEFFGSVLGKQKIQITFKQLDD